MLLPESIAINAGTGEVSPSTGRYTKRLSELRGIFSDGRALEQQVAAGDPVVYEVVEYRKEGSDLFFGTTIMNPGKVGDEFYMTRGHYHARRDMGEIYYTQSGEGILLLESRNGETATIDMRPATCAFIPPDWAHRSVNTGIDKLIFVWVCNTASGQDYGDILRKGMRKRVIEVDGAAKVVPNPDYAA